MLYLGHPERGGSPEPANPLCSSVVAFPGALKNEEDGVTSLPSYESSQDLPEDASAYIRLPGPPPVPSLPEVCLLSVKILPDTTRASDPELLPRPRPPQRPFVGSGLAPSAGCNLTPALTGVCVGISHPDGSPDSAMIFHPQLAGSPCPP